MNIRNVVMSLALALGAAVFAFAGDYTRLEYIEATGTQYIDTGVPCKTDMEMKMRVSGIVNDGNASFLGCMIEDYKYSWGTSSYGLDFFQPGANMGTKYRFGGVTYVSYAYYPSGVVDIESRLAKGSQLVTVTKVGEETPAMSKSGTSASAYDTGANVYAFARNGQKNGVWAPAGFAKVKCHSLDIWQDGVLVRSFRPAKRNSDDAVGMIDVANNNAFYASATETPFEAGPVVVSETITVAGRPDTYGEPNPGYGEIPGTMGESYTFTIDRVWTNALGNLRTICTGWEHELATGAKTTGSELTKTIDYDTTTRGSTLTWLFDVEHRLLVSDNVGKESGVTWHNVGDIVQVAVPESEDGLVFDRWVGDGVTEENKTDDPISVTMDAPVRLTAVFKGHGWLYDGSAIYNEAGDRLVVTASGSELTWTGTESLVGGRLDLDARIFSTDYASEYTLVSVANNCAANQTTLTDVVLPTGLKTFNMGGFANCSSLTNITPFLPATLTARPTLNGTVPVTNELKLCSPAITKLPYDFIPYGKLCVTSLDMRGSRITDFEYWAVLNDTSLTNVIFAETVVNFPKVNSAPIFQGCNNVTAFRFPSDPPTFDRTNPFDGKRFFYYLPKWNKKWEAFLADPKLATVSEMTRVEWDNTASYHQGEAMPSQMLQMHDTALKTPLTSNKGFTWWYPDPPPAYETVSWFDVLGYDGGRLALEDEADRTLVDGTTSTPYNVPAYYWLSASGHAVIADVPADCMTTRGLKLTGYRLHQMGYGDWPNGRAPTAWTLYGKKLGSDAWTVIDTVTMTAASENVWAYFKDPTYTVGTSKSQTCPPRTARSLTYSVPAAAQDCYAAFKFLPANSYNLENGIEDETPFGLMELELLGEATTPDPNVETFAVEASKWSEVDFTVTLAGLGEQPAQGKFATSATGWVEVYSDAERTVKVAESAKVALAAKTSTVIPVTGLSGDTAYFARFFVTNDLEGSAQADVECATLTDPWVAGKVVCTSVAGESRKFTVSIEIEELYADSVSLALSIAATPNGTYTPVSVPVVLAAAGTASFAGEFEREGALTTAKVTATGGGEERTYTGAAGAYWAVNDATNPTKITGSLNGMEFGVSGSLAKGLTLTSVVKLAADGKVDFTEPLWSADGTTQFQLASVGTAFKNNFNLQEIILPENLVSLPKEAFSSCLGLKKVRISSVFESFGDSCFASCSQLEDFEPRFPQTVTAIGASCFSGCAKLPNFVLPDGITSIAASAFQGCAAITEVRVPDTVTAIGSSAFNGCTSLSNFLPRCLPVQVSSVGTFGNIGVVGDFFLSNPAIHNVVYSQFNGLLNVTNIDLTGSSITNLSALAFYGSPKLLKLTLPACFKSAGGSNGQSAIQSCGSFRELVFRGPPPEHLWPYSLDTGSGIWIITVPRSSADWQRYIADHSEGGSGELWVTPMTSAEKKTFKAAYPGRKSSGYWINLEGVTGKKYLCFNPEHGGFMILVK